VDARVHDAIGDLVFVQKLEALASSLSAHAANIEEKIRSELRNGGAPTWKDTVSELTSSADETVKQLRAAAVAIGSATKLVRDGDLQQAAAIDPDVFRNSLQASSDAYYKACETAQDAVMSVARADAKEEQQQKESALAQIRGLRSVLGEGDYAASDLYHAANAFADFRRGYLHVLAEAGFGKTHLTCHITSTRVEGGLPAILLLGEQFEKGDTTESRIRQICDVPPAYSWADFVAALESYAEAYRTRVLIVIDALNEAESVTLWKQQLAGFMSTFVGKSGIVFLSTSRSSYEQQIWDRKH
jgi:hypothetical protein